jgi:perosamine synthetase
MTTNSNTQPFPPIKIPWWRTLTGAEEKQNMVSAFEKEKISYGQISRDLEKRLSELLNVPYVMLTTSGSTALYVATKSLGIGPGDEVLVQDRTFHATAHAALLSGASVRLVDVDPDLPVMNLSDLERKITEKTKAIMPVHLNGRANSMDAIMKLADKYKLFVIEDVAQAFYSQYNNRFLGTIGHTGAFSLGMTKLVSTGQGGFVCTHDKATYERFKHFISHGVEDTFDGVFNNFGFNFRMTDILAAMGHAQLDRLPAKIEHVKKIYNIYLESFQSISYLKMIPVHLDCEIPLWIEVSVAPGLMQGGSSRENFSRAYTSLGTFTNTPRTNFQIRSTLTTMGYFFPVALICLWIMCMK